MTAIIYACLTMFIDEGDFYHFEPFKYLHVVHLL